MNVLAKAVIVAIGCCWFCYPALAQHQICGEPPQLPDKLQSDEELKGHLAGQAKFLSGLVGKTELGGKIESTRRHLYQNSDKYFAAQQEAYLAYLFCVTIMEDKAFPTKEKLRALREFKRPLADSTPKSIRAALKNTAAIVIEVSVPDKGAYSMNAQFLSTVGDVITITISDYDSNTGTGRIAASSFGSPAGFVLASTNTLRIANPSPNGCSGSFHKVDDGVLRGIIGCKSSGYSYPSFAATIRIGG